MINLSESAKQISKVISVGNYFKYSTVNRRKQQVCLQMLIQNMFSHYASDVEEPVIIRCFDCIIILIKWRSSCEI